MGSDERYAQRLELAAEIVETNTLLLRHLKSYAEEHGIPLPTDSDRYALLEAQAARVIHDIGLSPKSRSSETELLQSIRDDCNREGSRKRVNEFLQNLPPEVATRFRHLLWTV
jgi:hypothetical protein